MTNLFPIIGEHKKKIMAMVDPETGEIIDMDMVEKEMTDPQTEAEQKNLIVLLKEEEAFENMVISEISRLQSILSVYSRRKESAKIILHKMMNIHGITELDFVTFGAKITKNPPATIIDPGADIDKYIEIKTVTTKKPNKNAIKKDLKAGVKIDGCRLESGETLRIF